MYRNLAAAAELINHGDAAGFSAFAMHRQLLRTGDRRGVDWPKLFQGAP